MNGRREGRGVMATLKAATADQHRGAEQHAFQQMMIRGALSREAYAEWLGQMLLIHQALEGHLDTLVAGRPAIAPVFDEDRRRVPAILRDLTFYRAETDYQPMPATTRFLQYLDGLAAVAPLALLGVLYVLEGSTNGARFIAKRLRSAYDLPVDGAGTAFVDPYGDAQPVRWRAFKDAMEELRLGDPEIDGITHAAQQTFDAIGAVGSDLLSHASRAASTLS